MKKIAVVDGAIQTLVVPCFNRMVENFPNLRFTYHPIGLHGIESLYEINSLDGLMIWGSASNVDEGHHPWHGPLAEFTQNIFEAKIPTFGICFGHQFVAAMFGAPVGNYKDADYKILGARTSKVVGGDLLKSGLELILPVSHKQVVQGAAEGMRPWLVAPHHPYDGLYHEDFPYWGLQHHPEAYGIFLTKHREILTPHQRERIRGDGGKVLSAFFKKI